MRTANKTEQCRRDFKRLKRGPYSAQLDTTVLEAVNLLAADLPLPLSYRDHRLRGRFRDCRDCYLMPDLLLVYRKRDGDMLDLIRIGTHSQLAF